MPVEEKNAATAGRVHDAEAPVASASVPGSRRRRAAAARDGAAILSVHELTVTFGGDVRAVDGVSLDVSAGETVAIVGESGSGKSTFARAILGLLPGTEQDARSRTAVTGQVLFAGRDVAALRPRELRQLRGAQMGFIPQDPMVSLNPVTRIGAQVAEVLHVHRLARGAAARAEVLERLHAVGLTDPARIVASYPHELSGGMRQRVLIAMALVARPQLVIADEPTSALDVTVQRRVLDDLAAATARLGTAVVLITHDLGVAVDRAQRIAVMSQGRIVEIAAPMTLLADPKHPYTRQLLNSAPSLDAVRITANDRPASDVPAATDRPGVVVRVEHLGKAFGARGRRRELLHAVDDVSFTIPSGKTVALVGESGSGKSTTARMLLGLTSPSSGRVTIDGVDPARLRAHELHLLRRHIQPVFQSPYASFDPRLRLSEAIGEPLRAFGFRDRAARIREVADQVALPQQLLARRPREVSGGQLQRAAIARALVLRPAVVVCDEPVSALDASLQSQILTLLARLQSELGLSYLLISHDLAAVRRLADTVCVMRRGRLVETGPVDDVFRAPADPYTRELLAAIPGRLLRNAAHTTATQISPSKE